MNSTTLTKVDPVTMEDRILRTTLPAHEIFHHSNGGLLVPRDDEESAWFTEGATNYMASRTTVRTGLIRVALFLNIAARELPPGETIRSASSSFAFRPRDTGSADAAA